MKAVLFLFLIQNAAIVWAADATVCEQGLAEFTQNVHPFLMQRCAECHDGSHYSAPAHSQGNAFKSYKMVKSFMTMTGSWQKSAFVVKGENNHCTSEGGKSNCGAKKGELEAVLSNWIQSENKSCGNGKAATAQVEKASAQGSVAIPIVKDKVIQITGGSHHACALYESGRAKCWGNNGSGRLGIGSKEIIVGSKIEDMDNLPYVIIKEKIKHISAGREHTCALLENGKAKCWGDNSGKELGVESTALALGSTKAEMENLPFVQIEESLIQIVAGRKATCAVTVSHKAKCWGVNMLNKLGLGPQNVFSIKDRPYLDVLQLEDKVLSISMGENHTCALLDGGRARCWGNSTGNIFGNGKEVDDGGYVPMGEKIIQVFAGDYHNCAVLESGRAKCWGQGTYRLGIGTQRQESQNQVEVRYLPYVLVDEPITQMAAQYHTCGVTVSGKLRCWGANYSGQVGHGVLAENLGKDKEEINAPILPVEGQQVVQVATLANSTCALLGTGKVKCWGDNSSGQLGVGDHLPRGVEDLGDNSFPEVKIP